MNVAIIGGGVSGVIAGINLKYNNPLLNVTIYEQNNKLLKKLLKTGNGKCNISNKDISSEKYNDFNLIKDNLDKVDVNNLLNKLGIFLKEGTLGRLYPYSFQAKKVHEILLEKIKKLKIDVCLETNVNKIEKYQDGYKVYYNKDNINQSKLFNYVILSTGSKAQEQTNGYEIVKKLGINVTSLTPGLVGIKTKEATKNLKGLRWKGVVKLKEKSFEGEIQFREDGISGICVMDASNYIKEEDVLNIDLMPEYKQSELIILSNNKIKFFENIFPQNLWNEILKRSKLNSLNSIIITIKNFKFTCKGKYDFNEAQITLGGIDLKEVNNNFELLKYNNLYATGEILNVNGASGGYNLFFAILSGYISSYDIINKLIIN